METEEIIKNLIAEINFWGEDEKNNADWNHIISGGILDSLAIVYLISLIEEEFNVKIPLSDISIDKFEKISDIYRIIQQLM